MLFVGFLEIVWSLLGAELLQSSGDVNNVKDMDNGI